MWTLSSSLFAFIEISSIGIITVLLAIIALFALIGFIKGLAKTALALVNLAVAGFAAFWGYNHGPSWLSQHLGQLPEISNIIIASVLGAMVFWALYKIFSFLANPFQDSKAIEKCGFGLPAALICIPFSAGLLFLTINRMRTTNELDHLKVMMSHDMAQADSLSGIHTQVMEELSDSEMGRFILEYDPFWQPNKAKLAKLAVIYFQAGPNALTDNPEASEILQDPAFHKFIIENPEIQQSFKDQDPSKLWNSTALEEASQKPALQKALTRLSLRKFG